MRKNFKKRNFEEERFCDRVYRKNPPLGEGRRREEKGEAGERAGSERETKREI